MIELVFEDEYFQDIKNGKKNTIGKIDADLKGIKKGDIVRFKYLGKNPNSDELIIVEVKDIKKFNDVLTMLKEMKLKTILPRSRTYKDGEKVFEETYGDRLKGAKFTAFTFDIQSITGPRIKDKKNGENDGPRIKDKKNGENDGPRIKDKKNGENDGPRIKSKKNGENSDSENDESNMNVFGPRIKNKKNGEISGPRIKNKKNGEISGPRIKNKKNGENIDLSNNNSNRPPREFEMTVSEPWFSLIENGQKQVEGRLFRGIVEEFKVNDTIRFIHKWNGKEKSVTVKITKLTKYPNFGDLLFHEKLYRVLPGLPNIKCGILVYDKIYSNFNQIKQFGTLAIELKTM
jgi:ASC-1-like (ASCH) protein